METFDWLPFLKQWSEEMLDVAEYVDDLPQEAVETRWLGFPGATEEQIKEAEERLGTVFPPSYRAFLKVSNGWRQPDAFWPSNAGSLWSTEQVEWFSVRNQDWIDSYLNPFQEGILRTVPDDEYFVYGAAQDCALSLRVEYLQTILEISDTGDGVYLLNPKVVGDGGEWEAWFFANWNPGADRYRSFWEMMQAHYHSWQNYLPLLKGEMSEEEYNSYAGRMDVKNV
jgi:hypothetical protein